MSATDGYPPAPPGGPRRRTIWLFGVVAALVIVLDQITKAVAVASLTEGNPVGVLDGVLRLHLTRNSGAAFGVGRGFTIVLSVIALIVVTVVIRVARTLRSTAWAVALGGLLGGALGNLVDRMVREPGFLRGHVVDFLELPHWPIFNVADSCVVSAGCLMVLLTFRGIQLDGTRDVGDEPPSGEPTSDHPSSDGTQTTRER